LALLGSEIEPSFGAFLARIAFPELDADEKIGETGAVSDRFISEHQSGHRVANRKQFLGQIFVN
jgi:hypothetical protein